MTPSTAGTSSQRRRITPADIARCVLVTAASAPLAWLCATLLSHRTLASHEHIGTIAFTVLQLGVAARYSLRSWAWGGIILSIMLLFPVALDRRCLLLCSLAVPMLTAVALHRWVTRNRVLVAAMSLGVGVAAALGAARMLAQWPGSVNRLVSNAWGVQGSMWGEQERLSRARNEWELALGRASAKGLGELSKTDFDAMTATAGIAKQKEHGDYLQDAIVLYRHASEQLFQAQHLVQDLGGGVTMKFAMIPAGEFLMGSPEGEPGHAEEETQHKVKLTRPFYMQTTPVTQAQWRTVMGNNYSAFHGDILPVENVDWVDAVAFCQELSAKQGKHFRLPTEAEWEYACRAGTLTAYGGTGNLDEMGWYSGNSNRQTHPVAQKTPNAWNLYDMHGNVLQWCSDIYGPYAGDAIDPTGANGGTSRVVRGGSWCDDPKACRAAYRVHIAPGYRNVGLGFRLCLDF